MMIPSRPVTSAERPLEVSFIPEFVLGPRFPGKLGMTICPGRKGHGIQGNHDRNMCTDMTRLRDVYSIDIIVSLMEEFEYQQHRADTLWEEAKAHRINTVWFPIVDMTPPANQPDTIALVGSILAALAKGQNVLVHCRGGLGRTGTIVACVLKAAGFTAPHAIGITRATRPNTIERGTQVEFVAKFPANPEWSESFMWENAEKRVRPYSEQDGFLTKALKLAQYVRAESPPRLWTEMSANSGSPFLLS